jgi:hypothetical protein
LNPKTKLDDETVQKMLLDLCKKHRAFNEFHSENKAEIALIKINWIIYENSNEEGSASRITDTITLKKYPESIKDARIVAHEIEHLLIWNQGYPYVMADVHTNVFIVRELATVLRAMIFEPLVESKLKKYFKRLCSDNQKDSMKELKKLIKNKENILVKIKNSQALLYYSCLYIKRRQLVESTCNNDEANEYIRIYSENFGTNIVPCAEKIISLMKKHDPNSPNSVKIILEKIIQNRKFGLGYKYEEKFNRFVIYFDDSITTF